MCEKKQFQSEKQAKTDCENLCKTLKITIFI